MIDQQEFGRRQVRAARMLLAWTQEILANRAGVGLSTLRDYERGARVTEKASLNIIWSALEDAGVTFTRNGVELHRLALTLGVAEIGAADERNRHGKNGRRKSGAGENRQGSRLARNAD